MKLAILLSAATCAALSTGSAMAASFTSDEAIKFADCLAPLAEFSQSHGDAISTDEIEMVKDGKIAVYSAHMAEIEASHPNLFKEMNGITKSCGFEGAEEFANVGNQVIAAHIARDMEPLPAEIEMMTPEMLAQLPAKVRSGIEMAKILENVPAEDMALITDDIAAKIDAAAESFGPSSNPQNPMGGMGRPMGGMPH